MSEVQYVISRSGDSREFITVIVPGLDPLVAGDDHPNYAAIREALDTSTFEGIDELFDVSEAVATRFTNLSERVTVANGRVYFDGDAQDDAITRQIVRFLDEDVPDWVPLVRFMENVAANPTEHSREQLYNWLNAHDFTITSQGNIVGYKGVANQGEGVFASLHSGSATVNGEAKTGRIEQRVGDVVEMPRSSVAHDPGAACSTGLHIGTHRYASTYARNGSLLKVLVNPRDVVSVPTQDVGEKVRVCRYTVAAVHTEGPIESAVEYEYSDECADADEYDRGEARYEQGYDDGYGSMSYRGRSRHLDPDYASGYEDGRADRDANLAPRPSRHLDPDYASGYEDGRADRDA